VLHNNEYYDQASVLITVQTIMIMITEITVNNDQNLGLNNTINNA
jgi:hypothetical protein